MESDRGLMSPVVDYLYASFLKKRLYFSEFIFTLKASAIFVFSNQSAQDATTTSF